MPCNCSDILRRSIIPIMGDGHRRRKSNRADIIFFRAVLISSFVSFSVNCCFMTISCVSGRWVFGDVFCQLYALASQVLVSGSTWMLALASLERCYRYLVPTEHVSTFSDINSRLIVYGVYLLLLVLHTAPLYGWGEYSHLRGGLNLSVMMADASFINTTSQSTNSFIFSTSNENSNNTCSNAGPIHSTLTFNPKTVSETIQILLQKKYKCEARLLMESKLTVILRFFSKAELNSFFTSYSGGDFVRQLQQKFISNFYVCNVTLPRMLFSFDLQHTELIQYRDVQMTFQEVGVCSLDFSPMNATVSSWIPFVVLMTSVIPYSTTIFCGAILQCAPSDFRHSHAHMATCLIPGAGVGMIATVPYYYINILNHRGIYVNLDVHIAALIIYYANSLFYVFICLFYGCIRKRVTQIKNVELELCMDSVGCYESKLTRPLCKMNSV